MPAAQPIYARLDGKPVLQPSLVAFVDLLGTSAHAQGERAQFVLEALDEALEQARQQSNVDEGYGGHIATWFSDNLAIASPVSHDPAYEGAVGHILIALAWLQFHLAVDGFFLRGGATVGEHFADDRIAFGPALVNAVALEKAAKNPRITLDTGAQALLASFQRFYGTDVTENPSFLFVAQDKSDDEFIVSYLGVVHEADEADEAEHMVLLHRNAAMQWYDDAKEDGRESVLTKAEWLVGYHNWFCRNFFSDWDHAMIPGVEGGEFKPFGLQKR